MISKEFLTKDNVNGFSKKQVAAAITDRRLELTLLPTEKCNFRCTYCYEDFLLGAMPPHVVEGIKNLITVRAEKGLSEISLSWFGGEPLLAKKIILDVCEHAKKVSDEKNIFFNGGLTTNGYLLDIETLTKLVEFNQDFYQISLDGWGEGHDLTRLRADGRGTFEKIWNNIKEAKNSNLTFIIQLRVHVTDNNYESLQELCSNIHKFIGDDSRFYVDFQDVRDLGGDYKGGAVTAKKFKEVKKHLSQILQKGLLDTVAAPQTVDLDNTKADQKINISDTATESFERDSVNNDNDEFEEVKKYESSGSRRDYSDENGYICYAAKPNHFLIRSNGRVGKCTIAFNSDKNDIGYIQPDGTIKIDTDKAMMWSRGFEDMDEDKLGCPMAYWDSPEKVNGELPLNTQAVIPVQLV